MKNKKKTKFKVGDKVQVIALNNPYFGREGIVMEILPKGKFLGIKFEGDNVNIYYECTMLKLLPKQKKFGSVKNVIIKGGGGGNEMRGEGEWPYENNRTIKQRVKIEKLDLREEYVKVAKDTPKGFVPYVNYQQLMEDKINELVDAHNNDRRNK